MFIGSNKISKPSFPWLTTSSGTKKIIKKMIALNVTKVKNVIHILLPGSFVIFLSKWLTKTKLPIDIQFATNPIIIPYKWEVDSVNSNSPKIIKKIEINVFA